MTSRSHRARTNCRLHALPAQFETCRLVIAAETGRGITVTSRAWVCSKAPNSALRHAPHHILG